MWTLVPDLAPVLGPVLGESRPFTPFDDRIVELNCHRETDDRLGNDAVVGMWWRAGDAAV
ncbi:MAG TPA: hypothetical protein VFW08_06745 [bacterium]|nr:hypothetical protein [bacterium]